MTYALISILAITGGVWAIRKIWPSFKVCPICAGVFGTWLWILAANDFGYPADLTVVGLLMGGSVVGIAYQLEKRVRPNKVLVWKILFISAGFSLAYNIIYFSWFYMLTASAVISLLLFIFLDWPISSRQSAGKNHKTAEIEEKMKNCC